MEKLLKRFVKLLPDSLRENAVGHAQEIDPATADYLVSDIDAYLAKIARESQNNHDIDLPLVERMVKTIKVLLQNFSSYSSDERMIISIALRYFLDADDAHQDLTDRFGFDDDLAVLNAALLALGRDDLVVVRQSD